MSKKKNFIIGLGTYPFDVMISIGETDTELEKVLSKFIDMSQEPIWRFEGDRGMGRFCLFETNEGLIRLREAPSTNEAYGQLQHEIFHYVMHLFNRIGLTWSPKSDEAYSYAIQYLTEKIYDEL